MTWRAGSNSPSFTPTTNVASASFEGAEMMTRLAPASTCDMAASLVVKRPVDSTTTSTPSSPHGSAFGSRSVRTFTVAEPTTKPSSVSSTRWRRRPWVESYWSRWALVSFDVMSFTATSSSSAAGPEAAPPAAAASARSSSARRRFRPILPKPFTPIRTLMSLLLEFHAPKGPENTANNRSCLCPDRLERLAEPFGVVGHETRRPDRGAPHAHPRDRRLEVAERQPPGVGEHRPDLDAVAPEGPHVGGHVVAARLGQLLAQIGHVDAPARLLREIGEEVADARHDAGGEHARVERARADHDLVRLAECLEDAVGRPCLGRQEVDRHHSPALLDANLAAHLLAASVRPKRHGSLGGGEHGTEGAKDAAGLLDALDEAARREGEGGDEEVPEGVPGEAACAEAVLEGGAKGGLLGEQGPNALAQVPRRWDAELLAQPPRRAAVVGHRDDGRDPSRVAAHGAERLGEPVAAAEGDDARPAGPERGRAGPQREMSRWCTLGSKPRWRISPASSSARTTLRC